MNKCKSIRLTLSKLIIIKLICAIFIHLLRSVSIHLAYCVYQITRMSQAIFRKYLYSINNKTTKDKDLFSSSQIPLSFARSTVFQ